MAPFSPTNGFVTSDKILIFTSFNRGSILEISIEASFANPANPLGMSFP